MSLLGSIEVTNFLNAKKAMTSWRPRYRGERFSFGGFNSVVQIPNGRGKTSILSSVLGILSLDKTLRAEMKSRMAPEKTGLWSHVRVEFIDVDVHLGTQMHVALGEDLPGRRTTFGACGNSNGDVIYYYFPRELDAARTFNTHPDGSRELLTNEEFREAVKAIPGHHWDMKPFTDKIKWLSLVHHHMPKNSLARNVSHLKRGAGDKSTELFKVSAGREVRGKPFDTRFFWQHIAPELLAGPRIQSFTNRDEGDHSDGDDQYFEDSISRSGRELLAASRNVDRQERDIQKVEEVLKRIRPLEALAVEAVRAEREQIQAVTALSHVVGLFDDLITKRPLPGLLRTKNNTELEGLAADILANIVWVPGVHGARVGQPALWNRFVINDLSRVGEQERRKFLSSKLGPNYGLEAREVIENIGNICCANPFPGLGGKPARWLPEADVLELIQATDRWKYPQHTLNDAVKTAFAEFNQLDTNPFRAISKKRKFEIAEIDKEQENCKKYLISKSAELEKLKNRQKNQAENEAHSRTMRHRGFSGEDCSEPVKTGLRLKQRIDDLYQETQDLNQRRGSIKMHYDEFVVRRASAGEGWTPEKEANDLEGSLELAEARAKAVEDELAEVRGHLSEKEEKQPDCEERYQETRNLINDLQKKAAFKERYRELFGEQEPYEGLEDELYKALKNEERGLEELSTNIEVQGNLKKQAEYFFQQQPDIEPKDWLQWVEGERSRIAVAIDTDRREIESIEARLERLETSTVAPAGDVLRAVKMIPSDRTWKTVSDLITETIMEDEDRRRVGTLFSSLLSAPVFQQKAEALEVRTILDAEDIQVPIFLTDGLTAFLKDKGKQVEWNGDVAAGLMLGRRNDIVESIVDPSALERQKVQLSEKLTTVSDRLQNHTQSFDCIRVEGELVKSAEAAYRFTKNGGEAALSSDIAKLPNVKASVTNAERRASTNAFEIIRNWRGFTVAGGDTELTRCDREYQEASKEREELLTELATLRTKISDLVSAQKDVAALVDKARKEASEVPALRALQNRVDNGDFDWFCTSGSKLEANDAERRQIEELRSGIDFEKAQQFVDGRDDTEDLSERIERLGLSVQSLEDRAQALGTKKTALSGAVAGLRDLEVSLDNLAASTIYRYRKIRGFIEASRKMIEVSPRMDIQDPLYVKFTNLRNILKDPDQYLLENTRSEFIGEANAVINDMKARDNEERRAQTAFNKAQDTLEIFQRRREELLCDDSGEELLAPIFGQFRSCSPTNIGPQIRRMDDELQAKRDKKKREAEDLTVTREGYMKTWQYLIEDGVKSHLSYLENILKATPDTTFELEVKVVEIGEWEQILVDILDTIEGIEKKVEEDLLSKKRGAAQEEQYRADIRAQIANVLYPRLFPEARIYVRHSAIGGEGRFPFDRSVSEGEFASLELLWTVKLAEFAFKRDAIEIGSALSLTPAQRRQAEKTAQGILIIDGLFSSLSDDDLIDLSLGDSGSLQSNFQIVGFLHPPHYRNNFDIFPRMLIGKTAMGLEGDQRHVWTEIVTQNRDGTIRKPESGEMVVTTMHGRRKPSKTTSPNKPDEGHLFKRADGESEHGAS